MKVTPTSCLVFGFIAFTLAFGSGRAGLSLEKILEETKLGIKTTENPDATLIDTDVVLEEYGNIGGYGGNYGKHGSYGKYGNA